ncbi:MAG: polymerase-associated protein RapA [Planctomycetota bacterium]
MTDSLESGGRVALRPLQLDFVTRFLAPAANRVFMLTAPPGAGKTAIALEVVRLFNCRPDSCRVLFFVPHVCAEHIAAMLRSSGIRSVNLNRSAIRTLRELGDGRLQIPDRVVVITGYDFLRRSDVCSDLASLGWDLIVADECHRLCIGQLADLVRPLLQEPARVLCLSSTSLSSDEQQRLGILAESVDWSLEELLQSSSRRVTLEKHVVRFPRTDAECARDVLCRELGELLVASGAPAWVGRSILKASVVGVPALDDLLRRWRRHGVRLAGTSSAYRSEFDVDGADISTDNGGFYLSVDIMQRMESMTRDVETCEADSRCEALLDVVAKLGSSTEGHRRTVVLVETSAVAYYVAAALQDTGSATTVILAGSSESALDALGGGDGFVVATRSGLKGIEFQSDSLVIYAAESLYGLDQIVGRFDPFGRKSVLQVIELVANAVGSTESS